VQRKDRANTTIDTNIKVLGKNIFRTECKFGVKCSKVVIGSGSIKNMVVVEMLEKLGLVR
jgi:hypothetical protein